MMFALREKPVAVDNTEESKLILNSLIAKLQSLDPATGGEIRLNAMELTLIKGKFNVR